MAALLPIIDAHIHFDQYPQRGREQILGDLAEYNIDALLSVSFHLESCQENQALSQRDSRIKPAFGFHPEQPLPEEKELAELIRFIEQNRLSMKAIGEIGLPYYKRKEDPSLPLEPYIELLEEFFKLAANLDKPVALHAVYEDAPIVCGLLEKHSVPKAHFHWFKGDAKTIERMIANKYYISVTPDILKEEEIRKLAKRYPLSLMMAETDGPWPFEECFPGQMTHPKMIHYTVATLSSIKRIPAAEVYHVLYQNTKQFYGL